MAAAVAVISVSVASPVLGGIGPLPPPCFQVAALLTGGEQGIQQAVFRRAVREACPELEEHREVEAGVSKLEAEGILPVNTRPHRFGGLPVRESFRELHDGHKRQ